MVGVYLVASQLGKYPPLSPTLRGLITSELVNQHAQKVLFTCVVYTNIIYCVSANTIIKDLHSRLACIAG